MRGQLVAAALGRIAPARLRTELHRGATVEAAAMVLLTVFILSIFLTEGLAVGLALLIELVSSEFVSLLIFFPLFFSGIFASWRFAVWYTRPAVQTT
jgi:hypothetical protein